MIQGGVGEENGIQVCGVRDDTGITESQGVWVERHPNDPETDTTNKRRTLWKVRRKPIELRKRSRVESTVNVLGYPSEIGVGNRCHRRSTDTEGPPIGDFIGRCEVVTVSQPSDLSVLGSLSWI